uniref:Retrotransposon gag domain-containing protein n=1 Tax=Tanacetum cinerariifolium TaxID=118510 RepID=A0A6L2JGT7_TANCI|nr:hypothetical protein [Tanacetum cinerariifolium]
MSDASSAVTYTSIYTDSEPWRYYREESAETGSLGVIHPPYLDYVPGPKHPPSSVEIPYVPELEYLEYLAPFDDEASLEDQPLPVDASPTATSPSYVADSDPDEDPEEDPEDDHDDYPANEEDGDDEPSDDDDDDDDDTDDKDEEPFEDEEDDEEEEEHLAPADSSVVPIVDPVLPAGDTEALEADEPTPTHRSRHIIIPLSHTRLRRARKTVRPEPSMTNIPKADVPPQKRACLTTPAPRFKVDESSIAGAARRPRPTESDLRRYRVEKAELDTTVRQRTDEFEIRLEEAQDYRAFLRARVNTLFRNKPDHHHTAMLLDREVMYTHEAWAGYEDRSVAAALAKRDAERSRNGDNNNDSRTGGRRQVTTPRECTYTDFLKCQPMSFQGTEGVVGLTRWLEKMESVFQISNCTVACQDVAYTMPWATLKRMITDKYCPRGEIQKLESEYWDLKNVPKESAKVERYIGGLIDMIHISVKASKTQSMQEAIEFAIKMMDKKMLTQS